MARAPRGSDLVTVLRGLARVGSAVVEVRSQEANRVWATSSLRPAIEQSGAKLQEALSILQQPQTFQREASKAVNEAVARFSMVTEGIKAYQGTATPPPSAAGAPLEVSAEYSPLYDLNVQELSIEEMMMQEALSGHSDNPDYQSNRYTEALSGAQLVADTISEGTRNTKEKVSRRLSEFEPLMDTSKVKEREITDKCLQAIDEKLSEVKSVAYGHQLDLTSEMEYYKLSEEVARKIVEEQTTLGENTSQTISSTVQELARQDSENIVCNKETEAMALHGVAQEVSIEEVMMQEVISRQNNKVTAEDIVTAQKSSDTNVENVSEVKDDISSRLKNFEPLLDIAKVEEQEITEEHLQALDDKLSELQDVAFGHNLKFFKEIEYSKPVEEVLKDVKEQYIAKEGMANATTSSLFADQNTFQVEEARAVEEQRLSLTNSSQNFAEAMDANTELDISLSRVAKPIYVEEVSTFVHTEISVKSESEGIASNSTTDETQSISATFTNEDAAVAATVAAAATSVTNKNVSAKSDNKVPVSDSGETDSTSSKPKPKPKLIGRKPLAKDKPKSRLSETAQARKVPHSRLGRLMSFGGLAAGLGVGTVAEVTRRTLGINQGKGTGSLLDGSPFLTEANAKRIVDTLCRVRGAALKLGQMMSIQDSSLINPQLQKIFERVRQSADFMPTWQLEQVIVGQLGEDWRTKVATFDERPFAAASIGQVHLATLEDGRSVAMKIQYPGVAEGIESDINNLITTLKVANILPEGLFVDAIIKVAKKELGWECDYVREAECTRRFRELVSPHSQYYVPEVIPQLCSQQVFTTELIDGLPLDKCVDMEQDTKNFLCEQLLRLCLMELFQFGFMQTDPNWSNFFYNAETEQIALLDFGACRDYNKEFVDKYIHLIHGAAAKDRQKVLQYSQDLGFLTGYEAKVMEDAHSDAIMILGEAFQEDKPFNFGDQNTTYRIQHLVPVMLSHRMCAPPEESYSLHRKMSGVFLLCSKLNGVVNCYKVFHEIYKNYEYGGTWEELHAKQLKLSASSDTVL